MERAKLAASVDSASKTDGTLVAEGGRAAPLDLAAGQHRGRDYELRRLLAGADCAAITVGIVVATASTTGAAASAELIAWTLVTLPGWVPLFKVYGLYDRDAKRVSHATVDDIPWIFHALVVGSVGLWLYFKVAPVPQPSAALGATFFAASFAALLLARCTARAIARWTMPPERLLFVGAGLSAALLEKKLRTNREFRLDPIGYVTTATGERDSSLDMPHLGALEDLEEICRQARVDRVLLVSTALDDASLADVIRRLKSLSVRIGLLPRVGDVLGPSVEIDDVEGITVLGLNPAVLTRSSRLLKRTMDLAIAVPAAIAAVPVIALAGIAIKLDSRGPIFYTQERVGKGGRRFRIYKLRTMVADADARAEQLQMESQHEAWLLLDHDPRITRVGRLLRHSSVDELPQLFNVISGRMSLVGPRPMTPDVDSKISGWGRRRLDLTPGITGLWQVLGRTSIPFEEMVTLDYLYVTNWSLWQDVRLLIRTLPVVVRRRGAN